MEVTTQVNSARKMTLMEAPHPSWSESKGENLADARRFHPPGTAKSRPALSGIEPLFAPAENVKVGWEFMQPRVLLGQDVDDQSAFVQRQAIDSTVGKPRDCPVALTNATNVCDLRWTEIFGFASIELMGLIPQAVAILAERSLRRHRTCELPIANGNDRAPGKEW
jgi:hypothetical protein